MSTVNQKSSLACDTLDGGFEILNDDGIVSSVIDMENIEEDKCYFLHKKNLI